MECTICMSLLAESPDPDRPEIESTVIVTGCGHMFHRYCIGQSILIESSAIIRPLHNRCPTCRRLIAIADFIEYRGSSVNFEIDMQHHEGILENAEAGLRMFDEEADASSGIWTETTRLLKPGTIRLDAMCFNCESHLHSTRDCNEMIIVRHQLPVFGRNYPTITLCRSATAGTVITDFKRDMKLGRALTRTEWNYVASLYHFGNACDRCGEPICSEPCTVEPNQVFPKLKMHDSFCRSAHWLAQGYLHRGCNYV